MPLESYFVMQISTNGGEFEIARAESILCLDEEENRVYFCSSVMVHMSPGASPDAALAGAAAANARHLGYFWFPDSISFRAFGNLGAAMTAVRKRVGVAAVTPYYYDVSPIGLEARERGARATLPYDEGMPVQSNGRFTWNAGDTTFVRVMQSSGYVTWIIPPPSFGVVDG